MRVPALLFALVALVGCSDKPADETGGTEVQDTDALPNGDSDTAPEDADGDGWFARDDCDDTRADVFPGAEEICNGEDDNCNDVADETFDDIDGDGVADCVDDEDCDGIDNDGDGEIDEGIGDADMDGVVDCMDAEECDSIDNDADGRVDEGFDADGDGYTSCGTAGEPADCDDSDRAVSPGAAEVDGDEVDNDCDGTIDTQTWSEGDLVITEVLANPGAVADPSGEWFEIYNNTQRQVWLNGLVIQSTVDADYHVINAVNKLTVGPGESAVLGANGDYETNGGVYVDYVYADVSLSNEDDDLLLTYGPTVIDQVTWSSATTDDTQGATLSLDPWFYSAEENDADGHWCMATEAWEGAGDRGSPGAQNEVCAIDHDGDGYIGDEDCDDYDADINPDSPPPDNNAPLADAGLDQSYAEAVTCVSTGYDYECDSCADHSFTLDGSRSSDPDGHAITYSWEIIDGADSATLRDETTASPTLTFTGPAAEFEETTSEAVTVRLTVTDCGGASDTDNVVISYDCSGE